MTALAAIPPGLRSMMARGVSVIVSSHDRQLRPSIMRALASELAADDGTITVYLARDQSGQLLQDIAATGHVAAVFSEPSTHRTVQVKANSARIRSAEPADAPVLTRYLAAMEQEIQRVGYGPPLTRAMLAHRLEELMAVSFEPQQAFDQTPGPRAGTRLGSGS